MKKVYISALLLLFTSLSVYAGDREDVMAQFDKYVEAANSYSKDLPNYYTDNARIIRVVNKRGGGQKAILIPFDRYLKELSTHAILAKTVNYKNRYEKRKISKANGGYKLSATRIPRNDKTGLPCYFVFTKTSNGWKIKEESMTTNVQAFINAQ